jgi:hypothetical protein
MPSDLIAKIALGALALGLFVWGWYLSGQNRAARSAYQKEIRRREDLDELEGAASVHLDGPPREDLGGLLDRWNRSRERRRRMRDEGGD